MQLVMWKRSCYVQNTSNFHYFIKVLTRKIVYLLNAQCSMYHTLFLNLEFGHRVKKYKSMPPCLILFLRAMLL